MEIPGFNDAGVEPDIQDYVHDGQIFEQGIIRIRGNYYICTLIFKKILSNFENMKSLIEDRIKIHAPKSLTHQVEMQKSYKGHLRMKSKLCAFVSTHEDVVNFDNEVYRVIKPTEKIMLESEMSTKERTKYKTYLEVKINTKMSDTIWDDCFNL
jgi:putative lipoic acid-binding regulatory protein